MASVGKILILVENLSVPFDRRVFQEALGLLRNGWHVSIVCPRLIDRKPFEILEGVRIYRYPLIHTARRAIGYLFEYPFNMLMSFVYALYIYISHGFQIIHACNPPDLFFILALPFKLLGVQFAFDQHDLCPEAFESKFNKKSGFVYAVLRLLEECTYLTANAVLATNESYKKIAIERGHFPTDKVWVVRSSPDLSRFKPGNPNDNFKKGKKYLVAYLGTMGRQDGIDYLLRSIRIILKKWGRSDIHFMLMGGGENLTTLKRMASEMMLGAAVEFTGRVSNERVCEVLSTADVCVAPDPISPLNNKSTMNKILEFMAMSRPIVSYRLTETVFSAGESALYAKDNDEEDFARKIVELLQKPDLRAAMGTYGYNRLKSKLSWEHSLEQLLTAYEFLGSRIIRRRAI
jgi:glycosyltransferase involved in cell wall biosynthesis